MSKLLPELFIDLDDNIYDLSEFVIKHHNLDFDENYDYKTNTSYFWQDTGKPQTYFEEVLNRKGIFLNGNPIGNAIEVINKLHKEGYKIYFVSLPQWNGYSVHEKVSWLKVYFPWLNLDTDVIFTGSKNLLDGKNRILLDDNLRHLNWIHGINVIFDQPWNKETGVFDGYRVKTHDDFYKLVHRLTDNINNNKFDADIFRNYYYNKLHKGDD